MKLIKRLFRDYYWVSAYRKKGESAFTPIPCPKGFWLADPFLFKHNGEMYAFFEYTNVKKNKSVIGYINLSSGTNSIGVAYEFSGHTSYPCIFEHKSNIYMIPETCYKDEVCLLECTAFPEKWTEKSVLLKGLHAVDTTIFSQGDQMFCFIYSFDKNTYKERKLHIGKIDFNNFKIKDMRTVVEYPDNNGRPGGNCFNFDSCDFRVVQPSHNFYGEKLVFYSFKYTNDGYSEQYVYEIKPSDIIVSGIKQLDGVHTYNRLGEYEIIDVRINFFDLFKPFKRLFRKMNLFGYSDYEKRNKFLY